MHYRHSSWGVLVVVCAIAFDGTKKNVKESDMIDKIVEGQCILKILTLIQIKFHPSFG